MYQSCTTVVHTLTSFFSFSEPGEVQITALNSIQSANSDIVILGLKSDQYDCFLILAISCVISATDKWML